MSGKIFIFSLSLILLLNPLILAEFNTGIIRDRNVREEDINSLIDGLSMAGKKAAEIILPELLPFSEQIDTELPDRYFYSGVEDYNNLRFKEAKIKFRNAIELYQKNSSSPNDNLLNSLFYLGAISVIEENLKEADKIFIKILQTREDYNPDGRKFPPKITGHFFTIKRTYVPAPEFNILVCSQAKSIEIEQSGVITPPRILKLKKGMHLLEDKENGYKAQIILKKEGIVFIDRENYNSKNMDSTRLIQMSEKIAKLCGLDEVLFLQKNNEELIINTLVSGKEKILTSEKPLEEIKKPFYKRWWFWSALGVAGTGMTIYFISRDKRNTADDSSVVVKW